MKPRILVIVFPVLGDVLLGTPLLRALRRRHPDARIDVLVNRGCGIVLEGNPDISGIIEVERRPRPAEYLRLARRILRRYDLAITTALSDRAAIYALLAAPQRVNWANPGPRGLGWKRRVFQRFSTEARGPQHPLLMNATIAQLLDLPYDGQVVAPRSVGATERVSALLRDVDRPLAVLHPASRMPYKHWHMSGWQTVAGTLQQRGYQLVVTGGNGKEERQYLDEIFANLERVIMAAGQLRLGDLGVLLAQARLFVGVDTSVTHLAAAAGLPTVVLFGPEDPRIWAPWPRQLDHLSAPGYTAKGDCFASHVAVLHSSLPCVPCRRAGCDNHPTSRSECLDEIQPQRVLDALERVVPHARQVPASSLAVDEPAA
jgi:heptosyltransferase-3